MRVWEQLVSLAVLVKAFPSEKQSPHCQCFPEGESLVRDVQAVAFPPPALASRSIEPAAVATSTLHLCSAKVFQCPGGSLAQHISNETDGVVDSHLTRFRAERERRERRL